MAKAPKSRALRWIVLMEAAWTLRSYWVQLPKHDRDELARLLRKSRGLPQNLTPRERTEFKRIVLDLDLKSAALRMAPIGRKFRKP